MTPEYIAGFFDGEGCIQSTAQAITITQKNPIPLREIQAIYGGSIRPTTGAFALCMTGARSVAFITALAPFLRLKRRQARLFLFHHRLSKYRRRGGLFRKARAVICAELRKEKQPV